MLGLMLLAPVALFDMFCYISVPYSLIETPTYYIMRLRYAIVMSRVTGHRTGEAGSWRHDGATLTLIRGFPYSPYRSSFVRYEIVPI